MRRGPEEGVFEEATGRQWRVGTRHDFVQDVQRQNLRASLDGLCKIYVVDVKPFAKCARSLARSDSFSLVCSICLVTARYR
jgi:hypothetical protein